MEGAARALGRARALALAWALALALALAGGAGAATGTGAASPGDFPTDADRALMDWFHGGGGRLSGVVYSVVDDDPSVRRLFTKDDLPAHARVLAVPRGLAISAAGALAAVRGGVATPRERFVADAHDVDPRWGVAAALLIATESVAEGAADSESLAPYVRALQSYSRAEPPALMRFADMLLDTLEGTAASEEIAALYDDSQHFAAMAAMLAKEGDLPRLYLDDPGAATAVYFAARRGAVDVCCDKSEPAFEGGVFWALVPFADLAGPGTPPGGSSVRGSSYAMLDDATGEIHIHAAAHAAGEELEFSRAGATDAEVLGIWGTAWERSLPSTQISLAVGEDGTEDDSDPVDVARRVLLRRCGTAGQMAIEAERPTDALVCGLRSAVAPAAMAQSAAVEGETMQDVVSKMSDLDRRRMDLQVFQTMGMYLERRLSGILGGSDEDDVKRIRALERAAGNALEEERTPEAASAAADGARVAALRVRLHEKQALVGALNHVHFTLHELSGGESKRRGGTDGTSEL